MSFPEDCRYPIDNSAYNHWPIGGIKLYERRGVCATLERTFVSIIKKTKAIKFEETPFIVQTIIASSEENIAYACVNVERLAVLTNDKFEELAWIVKVPINVNGNEIFLLALVKNQQGNDVITFGVTNFIFFPFEIADFCTFWDECLVGHVKHNGEIMIDRRFTPANLKQPGGNYLMSSDLYETPAPLRDFLLTLYTSEENLPTGENEQV